MRFIGPKNEGKTLETIEKIVLRQNPEATQKLEFERLSLNDDNNAKEFMTSIAQSFTSNVPGLSMNEDETAIPYDCSRVVLRNPIKGVDYINATWINRAEEDGAYSIPTMSPYPKLSHMNVILAQKPLSHTMVHYYQMLHENNIDMMVNV